MSRYITLTVGREGKGETKQAEPEEVKTPTLAELKDEAEALGLPTYGTKADLEARIAEAEEENEV